MPYKYKKTENEKLFLRYYEAMKEGKVRYKHYYVTKFIHRRFYNMPDDARKRHQFKFVQMCNWCKNSKVYDAYTVNQTIGNKNWKINK